ncbi:hypothetical protein RUND412_003675 [Rhizina undulata]
MGLFQDKADAYLRQPHVPIHEIHQPRNEHRENPPKGIIDILEYIKDAENLEVHNFRKDVADKAVIGLLKIYDAHVFRGDIKRRNILVTRVLLIDFDHVSTYSGTHEMLLPLA